jgi:cathepsin L
MLKHNKNYVNDAEFQYRLGVYRSNLEFVEEHNRLNQGFSVAMNQFGDLTAIEFGQMYNNFRMPEFKEQTAEVHTDNGAAPSSQDWRSKGYVTGVKDQGQCGSCWAFSTTGSTEGANFKKNGVLTSLSEQNLVDCSGSFGNYGCDGGLMDDAFQYIIQNGIDTEASYPYTAQDGNCVFNPKNVGARISTYTDVTSMSEAALQNAVGMIGPVSVAIDASHSSFQFYSGGVYFEPSCSATQLDHGVLAVGYDTMKVGGDYWIVKNSWGTSWGMSGYIFMARNQNNNCGIATMASYPTGKKMQ